MLSDLLDDVPILSVSSSMSMNHRQELSRVLKLCSSVHGVSVCGLRTRGRGALFRPKSALGLVRSDALERFSKKCGLWLKHIGRRRSSWYTCTRLWCYFGQSFY